VAGPWLVVVASLALAQGLDDRIALQDALLDEAARGDLSGALATYRQLARDLPAQAPLRGDALYWQGRAHHQLGQTDAARDALREGIRSGLCPSRCRDLLEQVELEAAQVTRLPVAWDFVDGTEHGLFHPWRFQDRGTLRPDGGQLLWTTESGAPGPPDRLVMAFDSVGRVSTIELSVRAVRQDARLQVVVTDRGLVQYGLRDALRLPAGQPVVVRLRPEDFVPVDSPQAGRLDPTGFAELWLVDITPQAGTVTLGIEQLTIR